METAVVHATDQSRYELRSADTEIGFAEYRPVDGAADVLEFHHTLIHPQFRGIGHAERLVAGALDDVRRLGKRVRPTCWFVDHYIVEHPDYETLRA